jgi:hypothetical protein
MQTILLDEEDVEDTKEVMRIRISRNKEEKIHIADK